MRRPSGLVLGILGVIVAFIGFEAVMWWPEASKKKPDEPEPAFFAAPAPPPAEVPSVVAPAPVLKPPPVREGRSIPQLHENENDELRRLEGCGDKHCGDPCILRCDPNEDGRCVEGRRPGACTVDGICGTTLPAVCPP
jgi:hypothetical protein